MNKEFWQIVTFILDRVLELEPEEQLQFIERECKHDPELKKQVVSFLKSINKSEGLWEKLLDSNRALVNELTSSGTALKEITKDFAPDQIGPYKINRLLARGGMGDVYLAERSDGQFHRSVAIKILRSELTHDNLEQRFLYEREILSSLEHPNIARLYDGGLTTDGRPYLVMEYVDGKPISSFCSQHNCSLENKLKLFTQVCEAVNYAHRNLIIHRDLKPDNIFVTSEGVVKVLDFGIAKIIDTELSAEELVKTQEGLRLISIQYAAPEQITLEKITTATDVYGLGLLLYEIVTGCKPYDLKDKKLYEAEHIIRHLSPDLPSSRAKNPSVSKKLKGDLDAIILKALRKEPQYRYQSAEQLLDDLNRYKAHLPVQAQKDSIRYRSVKFVKRHSAAIISLLLVISITTGFALYHTNQITTERNIAQTEAQKAQQAVSFLIEMFESANPAESLGDTLTVYDLLKKGVQNTETLSDQPILKSQMFEVIGRVYRSLGEYQNARSLLEKSYHLRLQEFGLGHPETVESLDQIGILLSEEGKFSEAESFFRLAFSIRMQLSDSVRANLANTKNELAYVLRRQGKFSESKKIYEELVNAYKIHFGEEHPKTISSMSGLATLLHAMNNYEEAETYYRKVLESRQKNLGPLHPELASSLNSLGALLMNTGDFVEAEELLQLSFQMRKELYGSEHPKVALTMNNLAMLYRDKGEFEPAVKLFRESLNMRKNILGDTHIGTCLSKFSLAIHYTLTARPDSAEILFNEIYPLFIEKFTDNHSFTARTEMGIGTVHLQHGNIQMATEYLERAYSKILQLHEKNSLERTLAIIQMGDLYLKKNNTEKALSFYKSAYDLIDEIDYDRNDQSIYKRKVEQKLKDLDYFTSAELPDQKYE